MGFDRRSDPFPSDQTDNPLDDQSAGRSGTIEVLEEVADVGIRRKDAGGYRVSLRTETEDVALTASLIHDDVTVTRHPVDQEIDQIPAIRTEGNVTIIPVVEERAVVVTRLFLKEEIHVRHDTRHEQRTVPATVRRQQAVIERLDSQVDHDSERRD